MTKLYNEFDVHPSNTTQIIALINSGRLTDGRPDGRTEAMRAEN